MRSSFSMIVFVAVFINKRTEGATYVRWGSTDCPGQYTNLVYKGFAGGSGYTSTGAAANFLCMPENPDWDKYNNVTDGWRGQVQGAEYQTFNSPYLSGYHDMDVPCAVCITTRKNSLMIPGKNNCMEGWTNEYSGYLMSGNANDAAATEYVCMDKEAEHIGTKANEDGKLFHPVEAVCGSLPCPPYVNGRELTCVVCTM